MSAPRPEVAEVIAQAADAYRARYGTAPAQERLLRDLGRCRTAVLGGHKQRCDECGHEILSYNSCRNRHCPKCEGPARARWLAARAAELLPVPYFHVVFTLPSRLGPLALQNKRVLYSLLFRAAAATLRTIARDPKQLGAEIGFLAVLHTWGQTLQHHPHLHCVVPGGGLAPDGTHWVASRSHFFLPVRVLSRRFRRAFLTMLRAAYRQGKLRCGGRLAPFADHAVWERSVRELERLEWVVYAKPPFGGPERVLKYLARYTHRVAIANQRLVAVSDGTVTFHWKDYAHGQRHRTMTLEAIEFLRRFLLHRLPRGFHHIRHYGLLGNRQRADALALCRQLLAQAAAHSTDTEQIDDPPAPRSCPACGSQRLTITELRPTSSQLTPRPP